VFVNGKMVYYPWMVANGGTTWQDTIEDGIPQSVILEYTPGGSGITQFNTNPDGNWKFFDMNQTPPAISWYTQGCGTGINPACPNPAPNLPAGYQGGTVDPNGYVYPAPIGTPGTGCGTDGGSPCGGGAYPVFIQYNSAYDMTTAGAYQTFVPPPMGGYMGTSYGWCTAVADEAFVYYAPATNGITGPSGNIFRYDFACPFANLTGAMPDCSGSDPYRPGLPSWNHYDMTSLGSSASNFQSVVWDSHRYVYYIPFKNTLIVRYDTWNGGSGYDYTGAGFTTMGNYTTFDLTTLNSTGPTVTGPGLVSNLVGFTGAQVISDTAGNEWLYFVPWSQISPITSDPMVQSTAARVRIGATSGSIWVPVDITCASGCTYAPTWEMYDVSLLTRNPAWLALARCRRSILART
jgi:hypothetical protein